MLQTLPFICSCCISCERSSLAKGAVPAVGSADRSCCFKRAPTLGASPAGGQWRLQPYINAGATSWPTLSRTALALSACNGSWWLENAAHLGPEIVTPLSDAVRLVHCHKTETLQSSSYDSIRVSGRAPKKPAASGKFLTARNVFVVPALVRVYMKLAIANS